MQVVQATSGYNGRGLRGRMCCSDIAPTYIRKIQFSRLNSSFGFLELTICSALLTKEIEEDAMSVRSIYKRLKDSPMLSESDGAFSELFQCHQPQDSRAMYHMFKLAVNDRDSRVTDFLLSSSKIGWVFSQAIAARDERTIDLLLSRGVSIGPYDDEGQRTAIHQAVYCGYLAILDRLFACCDDANFTDTNGLSHFHAACISGNELVARRFLLDSTIDPRLTYRYELSRDKSTEFTALHAAVAHSQVDVVELLLSHGAADPNAKDELFGLTPLHLACFRGATRSHDKRQLKIIELLLEHGSDVDARDRSGNTPLLAVFQDSPLPRFNSTEVSIDYQHDYVDDRELQKSKVELLTRKYRADARVANDEGNNALHLLIESMEGLRRPKALARVSFDDRVHVKIASLLLEAGARVNARNEKGQSPLQLAVRMLSLDVVELLLRYDATVARIRLDEEDFCYSEDVIPSLEATENLLGIVERLASNGLLLDKRSNLAVLKFLIGNHVNCRYDVWTDRNASYKLKNLLELGTDESIISAFAKFPLDIDDTTFKGQSMKKQMVQQLYEHATILEKGGFYVSSKVRKSLRSKISSLEKCILQVLGPNRKLTDVDLLEFENEFRAMKATSLSASTSLHDVLTMSPRKIYYHIKNYGYKRAYSKCEMGYSRSDGIMKGHFAKSLVRKYVSTSTIDYFRCLINLPLPDLCCERIFDYLDNDILLNLCIASTGLDFQKRKKFKNEDSL